MSVFPAHPDTRPAASEAHLPAPFARGAAHLAFRERVARFVATEILPHADAWDREERLPRALFAAAGRAGLLGLAVPREQGGAGMDYSYAVALAEELMRHRVAGAVNLMVQSNCVCPLMARHAGPDLADALRALAQGDAVGALGSTEPGGGSALPHTLATTAVRDGDDWVIDGEKAYITNAPMADWVLVLARTSAGAGPLTMSLIAVPVDAPGFVRGPQHRKLGLGGSPTGSLRLERCRVPARYTLGRPGYGYPQMSALLCQERLLIAAGAVAYARSLVKEAAADPANAADPARRAALASAHARLDAGRAYAHAAAARVCEGDTDAAACAMAKYALGDLAQDVAAECLRLRGPGAARTEGGMEAVLRDVRALTVFGGTSETMREMYGGRLAGAMRRATLQMEGHPS